MWPRTAAGKVLLAWACALGVWLVTGLVNAFGSTWAGRGISVAVAVGVAGGMSVIARLMFRRLTARPFPPAGLGGWLARRPPWLVGLVAALAWIIPIGAVSGAFIAWHHGRVPAETVWGLTGQVMTAVGAGLLYALVWQRQRQRVAAGSTGGSRSVTRPEQR